MKKRRDYLAPLLSLILVVILLFIPTGFEDALNYKGTLRCKARVLSVDNSAIVDNGLIRTGEQRCNIEFLDTKLKGMTAVGVNQLKGSMELDKIFTIGDTALVTVDYHENEIGFVMMVDHYRINYELILAGMFALFLILFAGKTGIRAILSFAVTVLMIWKILIPCYLKGVNPIWLGILITVSLTFIIIALVYGFDLRCLAAVSGATLGVLVTCILGICFTNLFKIHGAVMANSESLLYSGYGDINLTQIFMASIFIGSSGAMMDLAVDITSAVNEVALNNPAITRIKAIKSGLNVSRAAMGTMTTTLLLAYSGGYVALLMVFMAQGTPVSHILNYKYVSAEILHTVIGSFGLVTVGPFSALTAGIVLTREKK